MTENNKVDKICVSDYLSGIEAVFDPEITYPGTFSITLEQFIDAGKIVNGKNLLEEFFDKNYHNKIDNSFTQGHFAGKRPVILMSTQENDYGRVLKYHINILVRNLFYQVTTVEPDFREYNKRMKEEGREDEKIDLYSPPEKYIEQVKVQIKEYKKKIYSCLEEGINSPYYKEMKLRYDRNLVRLKNHQGNQRIISGRFEIFLENMAKACTNLSISLRFICKDLEKPIDLKKLEECVDLEKFYFIMAKQMLEVCKLSIKKYNEAHGSISYVSAYVNFVKEIRKKTSYDIHAEIVMPDGKIIKKYGLNTLIREVEDLLKKCPQSFEADLNQHILKQADFRDMKNVRNIEKYIAEAEAAESLVASWEFVPKGEKEQVKEKELDVTDVNQEIKIPGRQGYNIPYKKEISIEEKSSIIANRKKFLDQTSYTYTIKGLDSFAGYVGYIYPNGRVIFEKFYKDRESMEPVDSNATYVMDFDNFVEMSKKSKSEIMKYIKQGDNSLRRIYHTDTWVDRINQVIESREYSQEELDKIEKLINLGVLVRDSKGKK